MPSLKVRITDSGQHVVDVPIDSETALVGSGAHCDVRLGSDVAAPEQLFLAARPDGLFAEARSTSPTIIANGVPLVSGKFPAATTFTIGRLVIEVVADGATGKKGKPLIRPIYAVLLAVVIPAVVVAVYRARGSTEEDYFKAAPNVFATAAPSCSEPNETAANAQIESWLRDARGRHERSPFSPHDGVEAVGLYRKAASCLERFGRGTEAAALKQESDGLTQRLEKDFHVHRVRLWRALTDKDAVATHREVFLLRSYVSAHDGDYVAWLDYLDRKSSKGS